MAKGIYCYIDKKDNQIVYVGKDSNIDKKKRHRQHLAPSNYNAQQINRILQNNPDRYIYRVLWEIDDCTDNHLNQMEIFYIKKYDPQFNFTEGGDGISGFKHSEEARKKMSENHRDVSGTNNPMYGKTGENSPRYGKTLSEETRKKISESMKGKTLSEETRKKMSEAHKGENNHMYGKTHSLETRKKMSEAKKGKTRSEETRKKISKSMKAQNTTGFYRVSKQKKSTCKQGFMWRYQYPYKSTKKSIYSTNLKKLEKKVKTQSLPWQIVNENKARQSLKKDIGDI